jgi:hypothetical protein
MAAIEKRLAREAFTKKLRRLCERLDEPQPRTVAFKHWFLRDPQTSEVTITSLWVVGSYARGAADCGDLDVVLTLKTSEHEPSTSAVTKAFFGSLPYVRYSTGDAQKNSTGVALPEAAQIWSGPPCNWEAALSSIRIDPTAGGAAREMDAIPLRLEQISKEAAQNQAYPLNEGPEPLGLDVAMATGAEVLSLIGRCVAIELDGSSSQ